MAKRKVALQYIVLFVFWLILSGRFDVKYLATGLLVSGLVTFLTRDLIQYNLRDGKKAEAGFRTLLITWWRMGAYGLWLLFNIIKANFLVAYLVLDPRMPIEPALLQFRTGLQNDIARVVLANSITLTPGTVTVDLEGGKYVVHALVPQSARSLLSGQMQNMIGAIFAEKSEQAPPFLRAHHLDELEP